MVDWTQAIARITHQQQQQAELTADPYPRPTLTLAHATVTSAVRPHKASPLCPSSPPPTPAPYTQRALLLTRDQLPLDDLDRRVVAGEVAVVLVARPGAVLGQVDLGQELGEDLVCVGVQAQRGRGDVCM